MKAFELDALTRSPWHLITDLLADDPTRALQAIKWLRKMLDGAENYWVRRAWDEGQSFTWIGLMLGRSRQAVHMRYRRAVDVAGWKERAGSMIREGATDVGNKAEGPLSRPFRTI